MCRFFMVLCGVLLVSAQAQMNPDEMAVVRAMLDSAGMKDVTVESVAKSDSAGKIIEVDIRNTSDTNAGLRVIPASIGKLTQLQTLSLGKQSISGLPQELLQLTKLSALYLQNNNLAELPAWFGSLASLKRLDLRYNQLSTLPLEFFKLTGLQWLQLWGNQFATLPQDMVKLSSLRELYLMHNQVIDLPKSMIKMKWLRYFDFQDNKMCGQMPADIAAWLKKWDDQWKSKQKCW